MVHAFVPGLAGSATHALAIELYRTHHAGAVGVCAACGQPEPCPARRHAAAVIAAAGDNPRRYDRPPPGGHPSPDRPGPDTPPPAHGFHVGGRTRPARDSPGYGYEREMQ